MVLIKKFIIVICVGALLVPVINVYAMDEFGVHKNMVDEHVLLVNDHDHDNAIKDKGSIKRLFLSQEDFVADARGMNKEDEMVGEKVECLKADLAVSAEDLNRLLARAVLENNIYDVKKLLDMKANPDTMNQEGYWVECPVLCLSAMYGYKGVAHELLQAKAQVDLSTKNGFEYSPLTVAAVFGKSELVKLLLEAKAYIDFAAFNSMFPAEYNRTALICAMFDKHYDLARFIFLAGANPNIGWVEDGNEQKNAWWLARQRQCEWVLTPPSDAQPAGDVSGKQGASQALEQLAAEQVPNESMVHCVVEEGLKVEVNDVDGTEQKIESDAQKFSRADAGGNAWSCVLS